MDKSYSVPRRIWRILYPPLIFIAVQIIVMGVAGIIVGVSFAMKGATAEMITNDTSAFMEEILRFATEHSVLILLISDIICYFIFLPMWLRTRDQLEPYKNSKPGAVGLLVIGLFAAFNIVQMIIFTLIDISRYFPSYGEVTELLVTDSFILQILTVGIAAPVVEELVFRGIVMNRMMKWMPVWVSVLIQGLLFGLVHLNIFQGMYAFVAGILLGMVYVKFRSIIIVMVGHMAYNMTSILLVEFTSETVAGAVVVLSLVVLPVCAIFTIRRRKAIKTVAGPDILPPPVYAPAGPWLDNAQASLWPPDASPEQEQYNGTDI